MKIKVFLTLCIGSIVMLVLSSALVFTQVVSVRSVDLEPLTESLYKEDSRILAWILSTVPVEKIDTLKLPESWAEIFLVDSSDLQLTASTNQAHRGMPLYRHPLLLDQASAITDAIRTGKSSTVSTSSYMVVMEPSGTGQVIVALKPKAWEKGLVSAQASQIDAKTMGISLTLVIFLVIGLIIALAMSFLATRMVVTPTRNAIDALESLSLGNFDSELKEASGREMAVFTESYLRLKASLEIALEMITRR